MNKAIILVLILLAFFFHPLISAEDIKTVSFTSSSSPQTFTVYKGSYVDIPVTIRNTAESMVTCSISSSIGDKQIQLDSNYQTTIYFRYWSPDKIKNLNSASLDFETDCYGQYSYNCGFLWLDLCYMEYERNPFPHSVTINYELTEQDKANLAILENYQASLSSKITSLDSQLKTLKSLIDKTPPLLTSENILQVYNAKEADFKLINLKFDKAIQYLEEEVYDYASTYSFPSSDLSTLNSIENSLNEAQSNIESNIEKYQSLVESFNLQVQTNTEQIKKYTISFNGDLLDEFYYQTNSLTSRLENYDFSSIDEVKNTITTYQENYENIFLQLENRESNFIREGYEILQEESENICSIKEDCILKSEIINVPLTLESLCQIFLSSASETNEFNEVVFGEYTPILLRKGYNASSIDSVLEIKENVSQRIKSINEKIRSSVKYVNRIGKNLDLTNYTKLAVEFNQRTISEKESMLNQLDLEKEEIVNSLNKIKQNENNLLVFFKGMWFFFFGENQDIVYLDYSDFRDPIKLSINFNNFYEEACSFLDINIKEVNTLNIVADHIDSNIRTQIIDPKKACINEEGERTTNCCDDDSFRYNQSLYPVIFVHGHASETGQKTVQNSVATFNTMSSYFEDEGYIIKDLLYPEKTDDLIKGIWGYCNPVAVRVTYYEGIMAGGDVEYKKSIGEYSPTLKKDIEAVLKATNKDKAIVVSHSMGGILSRYYIKYDKGQQNIDKLITISSPHYGGRDLYTTFLGSIFGEEETKEMTPQSEFLNNLNNPQDALVDTYTIMGKSTSCSGTPCDGVVYVQYAGLQMAKSNDVLEGPTYEHSKIVDQLDVAKKVLKIIRN